MAYTNTTERRSVIGNKRMVTSLGTVNIVGDTYDTKLKTIEAVSVNSGGVNAIGCTQSGGTITFAGAAGAVSVIAIGI